MKLPHDGMLYTLSHMRAPYAPQDFAWINWSVDDIKRVAATIIPRKQAVLETIKKIPTPERTFENTVYALVAAGDSVMDDFTHLDFLMYVSPDATIRDASKEESVALQKKLIELSYDEDIYRALKEYDAKKESLGPVETKLLSELLRDYRRMGFDLGLEERTEVKEISQQLSELETRFQRNIDDYDGHVLLGPDDTEGLPPLFLERLERDADGRYTVGVKTSEYTAFMENAVKADKRKELMDVQLHKGGEANIGILLEILKLRKEKAVLLGYPDHAAYQTETRMAKTAEAASTFIEDLAQKLRPAVQKDLADLTSRKREMIGDPNAPLEYYDSTYYANQLKKQRFAFDEEEVRPYFPLATVKDGMFAVYEKLLGVKFERMSGYPAWHPDVDFYAINDGGEKIAYFFMDLFPREGKYGHAAAFDLIQGRSVGLDPDSSKSYIAPVASIVANFTKPSASAPSLLSHDEVETFFHEFGHIMHQTLTTAPYSWQSGAMVARDFVEAPSQMLENWIWNKDILSTMSGHYERPDEKLPEELLEKMLAAKYFLIAWWSIRQFVFGMFDLAIHRATPVIDVNLTYAQFIEKHTGIHLPSHQIFAAGFGHLMGYSAGYYGYMWSKVYAADMFTRFKKEGLLNTKTGRDYRTWILEKGSTMEEVDLVRGFLGREPNNEAFLKEIGL